MDSDELSDAIKDGKLEKVQELIGSRNLASPSELLCGGNLLCNAIEAGNKDIVRLLLEKGADVNIRCLGFVKDPPLIMAVRKGDTELVQLLLDKGANIQAKGQWGSTCLSDAITLGNINMVRLLLDNEANIYDQFFNYCSALDHASKCEKPEIIDLLISRGALLGKTSLFSYDCTSDEESSIEGSYYESTEDDSDASCDRDNGGVDPLYIAIQRGYVHLVEHYLKQGSNVNATCSLEGKLYTPLHFACQRYKKEVLEVLLRYGADVNAKAEDDLTPLHIAVEKEKAEFVEILLHCGANVDAQDKESRTPLCLAVDTGDTTIVKIILKYGPDVNNENNKNCLKVAVCDYGEDDGEDIVRQLLLYGFSTKTESTDEEVLHEAVQKGYLHFVDDFLKGTDINCVFRDTWDEREGYTILHTACEEDNIQMVKYLVIQGADVSARSSKGLTPLHVAARKGHGHIVELLISRGADVDDQDEEGNTALYYAAKSGCVSTVKYILKCRPRIDGQNMKNPLCGAVMCSHKERLIILKEILRYGFIVTPKDVGDYKFLHHAVKKGYVKIVKDLLKYIAKDELPQYRNKKRQTPLHYAAMNKRKKIVELLLNHGADVNAKDTEGVTPVCSLIYGTTHFIQRKMFNRDPEEFKKIHQKCMDILEILLRYGADPKTATNDGSMVLHYAADCFAGMEEIVKLFLTKGVPVNVANRESKTPLSITTYEDNRGLANLFLEHGGLDFSRRTDRKILEYVSELEYKEYFTIPLELHFADVNSVDDYGETTLQFAYDNRHEELARNLLEYGADVNAGQLDWLNDIDQYYSESAYIIKNQILKLKIAGLKVPFDAFLQYDYELLDLAEECREELSTMKDKKIANTIISYHDILTEDVDRLAAYAENESIITSVRHPDCENQFPLYYNVLRGFLWRGIIRKGLLKKSIEIFQCCCNGLPDLPDICLKLIMHSLTDKDLRVIIQQPRKVES